MPAFTFLGNLKKSVDVPGVAEPGKDLRALFVTDEQIQKSRSETTSSSTLYQFLCLSISLGPRGVGTSVRGGSC